MNIAHVVSVTLSVLDYAACVLSAVTLLATIVARLTPTKRDDAFVLAEGSLLFKILAFLPTIGVNPRTAGLQAAYEEQRARLEEKDAQP